MHRVYRIIDKNGTYVCERRTKKACIELLRKYAADPAKYPRWDNAPYHVLRIETEHVFKFKGTLTRSDAR